MPFALGLFLWLLADTGSAVAPQPAEPVTSNCGVSASVALCRLLGISVATNDIAVLNQRYPHIEVSMVDVAKMAGSLGVELEGLRLAPAELLDAQVAAIVHLQDPDHFAALAGGDDAWVQLLEGAQGTITVWPRAAFEERYTGHALVPAKAQADETGLTVDRIHHAFEVATAGQSVETVFHITNRTREAIRLTPTASSCSCTTTITEPVALPPGEGIDLPIRLRVRGLGDVLEHVRLPTTDPRRPTLLLSIGGHGVRGVELRPTELRMLARHGVPRSREVYVIGPPGLIVTAAHVDPLDCDVTIKRRVAEANRVGYVLEVTTLPDVPAGDHTVELVLETNHEQVPRLVMTILLRVEP